MSKIKSELSKSNPYWLEKHRYYELKHFCLQYPTWKKALASLTSLSHRPEDLAKFYTGEHGDPTAKCAEAREFFKERMHMIEELTYLANPKYTAAKECSEALLRGVTEGLSYDKLITLYPAFMPRDEYYKTYRKFFWMLSKARN